MLNNIVNVALLKSEIGDEKEFVVELLGIFKKSMISFTELVNEHIQDDNKKGIKEVTHKLAPSCQMLGLERLNELLRKIQEDADSVDGVKVLQLELGLTVQLVTDAIPQIQQIIENYE